MLRRSKLLLLILIAGIMVSVFATGVNAKIRNDALEVKELKPIDLKRQENMRTCGHFIVEFMKNGKWEEVSRIACDYFPRTNTLEINNLDKNDRVKVRIRKSGGGMAHLDSVLLNSKSPLSVEGSKDPLLLKKLSKSDNDVADAHNREIVMVFPNNGQKVQKLSVLGRIEADKIGKTPFMYPRQSMRNVKEITDFYSYKLNSNVATPKVDGNIKEFASKKELFKVMSAPASGHPNGYTLGWVCNDDKYLYAAMEFTPDNTFDGDLDYGKIFVKTDKGVKEFKVSVPEQKWGKPAFTYTDTVAYQHKTYEFKIPFSEIGKTDGDLQVAFSAYGTALAGNISPKLAHDFTRNVYLMIYWNSVEAKIYGQFVNPDGTTKGSEFRISNGTDDEAFPDVAFDPETGRHLVVWFNDTDNNIEGQLISSDGTRYGNVITISDNSDTQNFPAVAYDSTNKRFMVVFEDYRNSTFNCYGQIVNSDGTLTGTASNVNFPVSTGKTDLHSISIAFDSINSRFLVCWYENTGNFDIYGQLMNADGSPYGTAVDTNFAICNNTSNQTGTAVAFDPDNQRFMVIWNDFRNTGPDVYGQLIKSDGTLYNTASNVNFPVSDYSSSKTILGIAYSTDNDRYLALFRDQGRSDNLYGQYMAVDGSPLETATDVNFLISSQAVTAGADIAYNRINTNFMAAYSVNESPAVIYQVSVGTFKNSSGMSIPDSIDFGTIAVGGSSDPQTLTVTSIGSGKLYVNNLALTGTNASEFSLQNDSVTGNLIESGASGTVQVVFSPTSEASKGEKTATLVISSTDADTPDREVSLKGTTVTATPPPAPELVSPANGQTTNSNDVEFTWKEITESVKSKGVVAKYKLFVSTNKDFTDASVYEVNSDTSNKLKATGISVVFLGVVLGAWRRRKDGTKYLIALVLLGALFLGIGFTGCGGGSGSTTTTSTTETITYKVYDLNYGQTYYWKVEAVSSNGLSSSSETRSFDTPAYGL